MTVSVRSAGCCLRRFASPMRSRSFPFDGVDFTRLNARSASLSTSDNILWSPAAKDQVNQSLLAVVQLGITVCVSTGDDVSEAQVKDGNGTRVLSSMKIAKRHGGGNGQPINCRRQAY